MKEDALFDLFIEKSLYHLTSEVSISKQIIFVNAHGRRENYPRNRRLSEDDLCPGRRSPAGDCGAGCGRGGGYAVDHGEHVATSGRGRLLKGRAAQRDSSDGGGKANRRKNSPAP